MHVLCCGGIIASHWVNMTCFFGKSSPFAKQEACSKEWHDGSASDAHQQARNALKIQYLVGVNALNLPSKDS